MSNHTDDLREALELIIRRGVSVESCVVLREMLDRAELQPHMENAFGNEVCVWSAKASDRTLDRVAGIEDETERAVFELFVAGYMHFAAADFGCGLNIQWQMRPEHRDRDGLARSDYKSCGWDGLAD